MNDGRGGQYIVGVLDDVDRVAGLDAAMRLAFGFGGNRIYCAENPSPELINGIGPEAAHALSSLYPRQMILIPLGPFGSGPKANRIAREALRRGIGLRVTARIAGLSERAIVYIKRDLLERQLLTPRITAPDLSALPPWIVQAVTSDVTRNLELNLASLARIYAD